MEQLQHSYLTAIAAAAGCNVAKFEIDDGVDALLEYDCKSADGKHRSHLLKVQMKATTSLPANGRISAQMTRQRFDYYSEPWEEANSARIVVIMGVPTEPAHWVFARDKGLTIHRASYWVNLAGQQSAAQTRVTVSAPLTNLFDDVALCLMMQRVATGNPP